VLGRRWMVGAFGDAGWYVDRVEDKVVRGGTLFGCIRVVL